MCNELGVLCEHHGDTNAHVVNVPLLLSQAGAKLPSHHCKGLLIWYIRECAAILAELPPPSDERRKNLWKATEPMVVTITCFL